MVRPSRSMMFANWKPWQFIVDLPNLILKYTVIIRYVSLPEANRVQRSKRSKRGFYHFQKLILCVHTPSHQTSELAFALPQSLGTKYMTQLTRSTSSMILKPKVQLQLRFNNPQPRSSSLIFPSVFRALRADVLSSKQINLNTQRLIYHDGT